MVIDLEGGGDIVEVQRMERSGEEVIVIFEGARKEEGS